MANPRQLWDYPETVVDLWRLAEDDILEYMARRIAALDFFLPAAQWQMVRLEEMGMARREIMRRLAQKTGKTRQELKKLLTASGAETLAANKGRAEAAGFDDLNHMSADMRRVVQSGLDNTMGLLENVTGTTADTAGRQFEKALDRAWTQVQSGGFSPEDAIRFAIKSLAASGLESIQYPSKKPGKPGKVDHLDVAVRRAVRTGLNQTAIRMTIVQAAELGTPLAEVTAHAGARTGEGIANHAGWQGGIYDLRDVPLFMETWLRVWGDKPVPQTGYPSIVTACGYGKGDGLGGWNCRHGINLIFIGQDPTYTPERLAEMNAPKYTYNGKLLTEEQARTKQREIEREIRKWKREYLMLKAAGQPTGQAAEKLAEWNGRETDFLAQTGLKRQDAQTWVNRFDRSASGSAKMDARKAAGGGVKSGGGSGTMMADKRGRTDGLHPVTAQVVERLQLPTAVTLNHQQNAAIQENAKQLLEDVALEPLGTEYAYTYRMGDMRFLRAHHGPPGGRSVDVPMGVQPYALLHNHASGETFSPEDVGKFAEDEHLRIMYAVGHDGRTYMMEKVAGYDYGRFWAYVLRAHREYEKNATQENAFAFIEAVKKRVTEFGIRFQG